MTAAGGPAPPGPGLVVSRVRWMYRLRVRQWIAMVTVGFVATLLIIGVIGWRAYTSLADARGVLVGTVDPAQLATGQLENALLNQQTGVRGYVLTGSTTFLQPYDQGLTDEAAAVEQLKTLIGGASGSAPRASMAADLAAVEQAADAWRTSYAVPAVNTVRTKGNTAVPSTLVNRGESLFATVRARLSAAQAHLTAAHDATIARVRQQNQLFEDLSIAGLALLLALVIAVAAAIRRAVTQPIVRLSREVGMIAAGDFDYPIHVRGPVEIRTLAYSVDEMRRRLLASLRQSDEARARAAAQALELARSNTELEQFAYVASHDLQEPLRKVASFCQLLERRYGTELDERGHQYIGFAVDGAKRMQVLINDLLAFSRVGRGGEALGPVDMNAVVDSVLDALSTVLEDAGADVAAGELPAVLGDAGLLRQLIQNLVSNAIKFHGPQPPRVRITARRTGAVAARTPAPAAPPLMPSAYGVSLPPVPASEAAAAPDQPRPVWEFAVEDNGIGIEPEYADRIFVIFQRLHSRDTYGGTGIGLAMCRKIVEYHGGRIWLDTTRPPGTGAMLRFTLLEAVDGASQSAADGAPAPAGREATLSAEDGSGVRPPQAGQSPQAGEHSSGV